MLIESVSMQRQYGATTHDSAAMLLGRLVWADNEQR